MNQGPVEEGAPAPRERKSNVKILLAFLAVFLLLIVVFRSVLFPFLMAIFLAYLIEPIVARIGRSRLFGIRWTRGPTIVLIYIVFVGGLSFGVWKGLTAAAKQIQTTSSQVAREMKREGGRAVFALAEPLGEDVSIPAGTAVWQAGPPRLTYRTLHEVLIQSGDLEGVALMDLETPEVKTRRPAPDDALEAALDVKDGQGEPVAIAVRAGDETRGVELFFERHLTSPVVENLGKVGVELDPSTVRTFIDVKAHALQEDLPSEVVSHAVATTRHLVLSVYEFFLILMITAFIVMDRRGIAEFFASLPPMRHKEAYHKLVRYVDDGLAGVIRGQLVVCGVNGVLTYIGLVILGVKGALLLSVIAAVLSLIPIFGTIISTIPIVLVALTDGVEKGVLALVWVVFIHLLEANLLNPMIMGSHARMHPVVIIFALLAGEHSFGAWGALLAVPTASIVQSAFQFYLHEIEGLPKRAAGGGHGEGLRKLWARLRRRFGPPGSDAGAAG